MWDHEALKVEASRDPPFTEQPHLFWLPSLALLTSTKAEIQSRSFLFRTFLRKTQPQRLLGHGRTGGKQVWQDEHCDSGRPDVHCKTASLQGKQHRRALKHSLHCLNEENAPRARRQGEGMAFFRAQSQAEVMGQWFYRWVACTRPLEFFLIVFGTWSILRRRKTHTWRHRCH